MKKFIYSALFRLLAFVICIASMISVGICSTGLIMHFTNSTGSTSFLDKYISTNYNAFYNHSKNLLHNLVYHDNGYGNTDGVYEWYGAHTTNMRFVVQKRRYGEVVFDSTGGSGKEPWYTVYYKAYVANTTRGDISSQLVMVDEHNNDENTYAISGYIDTTFPIFDEYSKDYYFLKFRYDISKNVTLVGIALAVSVFIMLSSFVFLLKVAGRTKDGTCRAESIKDKIPFDLILGLLVLAVFLMVACFIDGTRDELLKLIFTSLTIMTGCVLFLGASMTFASRVKNRRFLKNNIIYIVLKFIFNVLKRIISFAHDIPFVLRSVLVVVIVVVVDLIILISVSASAPFSEALWVIKTLAYGIAAIYVSIVLYRLKKGGEALARGDLEYKTDTSLFLMDFKQHGENLNSIAMGMHEAVENRMKSERMKTELITNVSHDLKTPLTSIINYSELIAKEECENKNHREYSDVLLRKSKHLKRLLEDLLEVSKATSGNMDVSLSQLDAGILLNQLSGEFQDKVKESGLQLVVTEPAESLYVMADERRIWRVFENLMNNACKYSLKGSRIYIVLSEKEDNVVFSFKNTSATELNISASELMERFVRGDSSRSTEGSGLGLSIASTFTEIQGGRFEITVDGDLFRVDVTLKKA